MDMAELARVFDEDLDQETPAAVEDLAADRPGGDRLHLRHDRRAARRPLPAALPRAASGSRPSTGSGPASGEVAWCTAAPGWAKSTRNAFIAPWLGGAAAVLHDGRFDPAERLRLCEELGVNVLCQAPTEYRMLAKRDELRAGCPACAAWSPPASRSSPR